MQSSKHFAIIFITGLCLHVCSCSSSSNNPEEQANVWDDGTQSSNILIWNDGANNNTTQWAE